MFKKAVDMSNVCERQIYICVRDNKFGGLTEMTTSDLNFEKIAQMQDDGQVMKTEDVAFKDEADSDSDDSVQLPLNKKQRRRGPKKLNEKQALAFP